MDYVNYKFVKRCKEEAFSPSTGLAHPSSTMKIKMKMKIKI